jgi:hypothetical protein
MDTTRAKCDLGWVPHFTALEALRDTLRPGAARGPENIVLRALRPQHRPPPGTPRFPRAGYDAQSLPPV